MIAGKEYLLRAGTAKVPVWLEEITRVIDASNLAANEDAKTIGRHDVAECVLRCEQPVAFDIGAELAETSRFVLISDYEISGGGIVHDTLPDAQTWVRESALLRNLKWEGGGISRDERRKRYRQNPAAVVVAGSDEAGRKELARGLERELWSAGYRTYYLGIGSVVYGVDADLKAREPDSRRQHREEHLRRFAEVANVLLDSGLVLVCTAADLDAADVELIRADLSGERVLVLDAGGPSLPAELVDHTAKKGASTDATLVQFKEAVKAAVSAEGSD